MQANSVSSCFCSIVLLADYTPLYKGTISMQLQLKTNVALSIVLSSTYPSSLICKLKCRENLRETSKHLIKRYLFFSLAFL